MIFLKKHVNIIGSTNVELMKNYDIYNNYTILSANHQTQGKGRLDRKWVDNKSGNLMFSILLKNVVNFEDISKLNYTVCASIISVLEKFNIIGEFKWPNDVLVKNKKISGVLIESKVIGDEVVVVIGQGINVNSASDNSDGYIYMSDIIGKNIPKEDVLDDFIYMFNKYFLSYGAYKLCSAKHCYYGKSVEINGNMYTVLELQEDGSIILKDSNSIENIYFGNELSLSRQEFLEDE